MMSYFCACLFWIISSIANTSEDIEAMNTFKTSNDLTDKTDVYNLILICYFALTTLSTVGYGDFSPISISEKLITIVIQLAGVAVFSYAMGMLTAMLEGGQGKNQERLEKWQEGLRRFPGIIPKSLDMMCDEMLQFVWQNDR